MNKSKIYIASSESAFNFADRLKIKLNEKDFCVAYTWKDAIQTANSMSKIGALTQWIKEYDFAVIIFQEDILGKNSSEDMKTRDDCVFEAGLFMAAIGRSRCFLYSSVNQNDLPSDLGGIIYKHFMQPDNFDDNEQCQNPISQIAAHILDQVQKDKGKSVANRPISYDASTEEATIGKYGLYWRARGGPSRRGFDPAPQHRIRSHQSSLG